MSWIPDVSEHNGVLDWNAIAAAKPDAVAIRSSFGTVRADSRFFENFAEARVRGLRIFTYHFAYPAYNTPEAEAAFAWELAQQAGWREGDGHMLDCEDDPETRPWPLGRPAREWAAAYLQAWGPAIYAPPWYASTSFVIPHDLQELVPTWKWWQADYRFGPAPDLGLAPVLRQYTDNGPFGLDASVLLRGSIEDVLYHPAVAPVPREEDVTDIIVIDPQGAQWLTDLKTRRWIQDPAELVFVQQAKGLSGPPLAVSDTFLNRIPPVGQVPPPGL